MTGSSVVNNLLELCAATASLPLSSIPPPPPTLSSIPFPFLSFSLFPPLPGLLPGRSSGLHSHAVSSHERTEREDSASWKESKVPVQLLLHTYTVPMHPIEPCQPHQISRGRFNITLYILFYFDKLLTAVDEGLAIHVLCLEVSINWRDFVCKN